MRNASTINGNGKKTERGFQLNQMPPLPQQATQLARRYFMVRSELFQVEKDRVAVGWKSINFSQFGSGSDLLRSIREHYGPIRSAKQVRRFFEMREGDVVVVPFPKSIAIGIVASPTCNFEPTISREYPNMRAVHFRRQDNQTLLIPRTRLGTALQTRLRAPGLFVNELADFAGELGQLLEMDSDFTFRNHAELKNSGLTDAFKVELMQRIQHGKTHLPAGGRGLEQLIRELLDAQGYVATVLGTRGFDGKADADILAEKTDSFSTTRLLVQVKHHHGKTGSWGVEQLNKIREDPRYDDHNMILVSSAAFTEETTAYAGNLGIELVDGERLATIILENISSLRPDTLHQLGISSAPQLLPLT